MIKNNRSSFQTGAVIFCRYDLKCPALPRRRFLCPAGTSASADFFQLLIRQYAALVHGSFYVVAKIRITISAPPLNLAFRKQLPSTAGEVNPPFVATLRSAARTSPLGDCLSDWADALGVLLHVPRRMGADKSFTGRLLRTTALAGFRNVHRKFLSAFAKRVQFNE